VAHTNVPQLPRSGFPQVKIQLCPLMAEMVDQAFSLSTCSYTTPETSWGACDGGFPCGDPATSLIDGQAFCAAHARTVSRG
jgi:hypothetical protein